MNRFHPNEAYLLGRTAAKVYGVQRCGWEKMDHKFHLDAIKHVCSSLYEYQDIHTLMALMDKAIRDGDIDWLEEKTQELVSHSCSNPDWQRAYAIGIADECMLLREYLIPQNPRHQFIQEG